MVNKLCDGTVVSKLPETPLLQFVSHHTVALIWPVCRKLIASFPLNKGRVLAANNWRSWLNAHSVKKKTTKKLKINADFHYWLIWQNNINADTFSRYCFNSFTTCFCCSPNPNILWLMLFKALWLAVWSLLQSVVYFFVAYLRWCNLKNRKSGQNEVFFCSQSPIM